MRVLLSDECPIVLQGLKELLTYILGIEIVGQATKSEEVLRLTKELKPDCIILDPEFKAEAREGDQTNRITRSDFLWELRRIETTMLIIVYSGSNTTADLMALKLAKVNGYIHKSTLLKQLAQDLQTVVEGGRLLWRLGLEHEEAQKRLIDSSSVERLSCREKEIMVFLLKGYNDMRIAKVLNISPYTAKRHIVNILKKLEYPSRRAIFCECMDTY